MAVQDDIREIRNDIKELVENTSNMLGHFDAHVQNKAIHQLPPCEFHLRFVGRLWALAVGVLAALAGSAYAIIKGH